MPPGKRIYAVKFVTQTVFVVCLGEIETAVGLARKYLEHDESDPCRVEHVSFINEVDVEDS